MSVIINYTKAQYEAKITELQGYYASLETHLDRMKELKKQMFNFWDDPEAQQTGLILNIMIQSVEHTMAQTNDMLIFYKTAVEKFMGVNAVTSQLLENALGMLGGMGGR